MKKSIWSILSYILLVGLAVLLARVPAGFEVFPVYGYGLRISLGVAILASLGILFGPVKGTVGAMAAMFLSQTLVADVAFAGEYTWLALALVPLIAGMLTRRNWVGGLLVALGVLALWLRMSRGLEADVFASVFVAHMFISLMAAGIFGTELAGSPQPVLKATGWFMMILAAMSTGIVAVAALSASYYILPEYMWNGINLYSFLGFLYRLSLISLIPLLVARLFLPSFFVLDDGYWRLKNTGKKPGLSGRSVQNMTGTLRDIFRRFRKGLKNRFGQKSPEIRRRPAPPVAPEPPDEEITAPERKRPVRQPRKEVSDDSGPGAAEPELTQREIADIPGAPEPAEEKPLPEDLPAKPGAPAGDQLGTGEIRRRSSMEPMARRSILLEDEDIFLHTGALDRPEEVRFEGRGFDEDPVGAEDGAQPQSRGNTRKKIRRKRK